MPTRPGSDPQILRMCWQPCFWLQGWTPGRFPLTGMGANGAGAIT
ncbi:MAG TPA: hypothetical protein VJT16_20845 [Streptosporangiaceae bacterium]|nr:hypothetical protein [Streptosporangiaceae bacterium]